MMKTERDHEFSPGLTPEPNYKTTGREERQMKKPAMTTLLLGVLMELATGARAQDTPVVDVATGYSFFYVVKGLTLVTNGGGGSVAFNANNWLGIAGDFGVYQAAPSSHTGLTVATYALGPRFSYRKLGRVVPFGQILVGGGHGSELAGGFTGVNSFLFGGGGGADIVLGGGGKFALQPQLDYFGFRANGGTTNTVRLSIGIVFRIGRRR